MSKRNKQIFRVWVVELHYTANGTWEPRAFARNYRDACYRLRAFRASPDGVAIPSRIREYVRKRGAS